MNYHPIMNRKIAGSVVAILLIAPAFSAAQVPVDDDGKVIGSYEAQSDAVRNDADDRVLSTAEELQELVGPVALYPDDLLAIVLPASAYPLQVASAGRFLAALKNDSSLKPDPDWDDSVVALINYPEVVELMNDDLDWTYRLGEAVIAQQADVVAAVEAFRDRAYTAGNLKSDEYQTVSHDDGIIEISPIADDVIYVPYYEPRRVVVYQPRPVYYYHPHAYPVYYYPYASHHYFDRGYFWGVTTAFSIGWYADSLNVFHHSYHGHPYYGHNYYRHHGYRRPSISIYNTSYVNNRRHVNNREGYANRYREGDRWQARNNRRVLTRRRSVTRATQSNQRRGVQINQRRTVVAQQQRNPIRFRGRDSRPANRTIALARDEHRQSTNLAGSTPRRQVTTARARDTQAERRDFTFRDRNQNRSSDSDRSRRVANTRNTQRRNVVSQPRQRQTDSGRARVNTTRRDGAAERRRPAPVKRTQQRQEQPPQPAAAPKRQERSKSSVSRSKGNSVKRGETRSRERRR